MMISIITIILSINTLLILGGELESKFYYLLRLNFGENVQTEKIEYKLPVVIRKNVESAVGQKFFRNIVYIWKINSGGKLKGYAVLDNVLGKVQPITFAVFFNDALQIRNVEILKYRESYGGQVGEKNWRKQFENKNAESKLELGKDIESITGATISARAVTKGVKKLAVLLKKIRDKL